MQVLNKKIKNVLLTTIQYTIPDTATVFMSESLNKVIIKEIHSRRINMHLLRMQPLSPMSKSMNN